MGLRQALGIHENFRYAKQIGKFVEAVQIGSCLAPAHLNGESELIAQLIISGVLTRRVNDSDFDGEIYPKIANGFLEKAWVHQDVAVLNIILEQYYDNVLISTAHCKLWINDRRAYMICCNISHRVENLAILAPTI